jgi:4-hydroxy-tetrahydrodipicolinate reductase
MKIALLGYGKMGKTVDKIATERGHEIVLRIDVNSDKYDISKAEIAIDFSTPETAVDNITNCFNHQVPIVSGTTGWLDRYDEMTALCLKSNSAFIYASNFSLGVNLFFALNRQLAKLMNNVNDYKLALEEIHHMEKLDTPSGTAITLAEGIIEVSDKKSWTMDVTNNPNQIPIIAKRLPDVPGTHTVSYTSGVDEISIQHKAHNRQGFALGAVIAAEWLHEKKGVFSMKDVLGLH